MSASASAQGQWRSGKVSWAVRCGWAELTPLTDIQTLVVLFPYILIGNGRSIMKFSSSQRCVPGVKLLLPTFQVSQSVA